MIKQVVDEVYVKATIEQPYSLRRHCAEEEVHKLNLRDAKALIADIKRHCDNYGYLSVEADSHWECGFCGYKAVDKDDCECCDGSMAEHDRLAAEAEPKEVNNGKNS